MAPRILRNRFDIVIYTARKSRLQWTSRKDRSLPMLEIAKCLRSIADTIDATAAADVEPGAAVDIAAAREAK